MEYICDLKGFKSVKGFILKELVLISVDSQAYELHLFQPSDDLLQKQVLWEERYGMFWGSGFREYNDLQDIFDNVKIQGKVYVKGREKQKLLADVLSNLKVKVINIEEFGCPNLQDLKCKFVKTQLTTKSCSFKHNTLQCVYINVHVLLKWFQMEKLVQQRLEVVNKAIKNCYEKGYNSMSSELVKYLPKEFLLNHTEDIENIYDKLPEKLKNDTAILLNMKCYDHNEDVNPKRKYCPFCINELYKQFKV